MIQSLQPKGREFESTCVLFFLPLFDSFNFIYYRCTTTLTKTNASIDKQITLKRVYIYKIENTDLEIGVSGVLLRILFYFEARRCSRQTGSLYALRINLLHK